MSKPTIVFDMDGVLVDVTESYRETIAQTVEHFTGKPIGNERIQECKNQGGWNDDWELTHHLIGSTGANVPFAEVQAHFQRLFLGDGDNGLIRRERWIAEPGALEQLSNAFRLAIFTGRPKDEVHLTLDRFAGGLSFDPIVAMHDVVKKKPAPDGLLQIVAADPGSKLYYVGDTVDDARSARAAKVPFIGVTAPDNPSYLDLVFLFQEQGAYAIVDNINYLRDVFAS
jgi:HAD superfamily phosphatase